MHCFLLVSPVENKQVVTFFLQWVKGCTVASNLYSPIQNGFRGFLLKKKMSKDVCFYRSLRKAVLL